MVKSLIVINKDGASGTKKWNKGFQETFKCVTSGDGNLSLRSTVNRSKDSTSTL